MFFLLLFIFSCAAVEKGFVEEDFNDLKLSDRTAVIVGSNVRENADLRKFATIFALLRGIPLNVLSQFLGKYNEQIKTMYVEFLRKRNFIKMTDKTLLIKPEVISRVNESIAKIGGKIMEYSISLEFLREVLTVQFAYEYYLASTGNWGLKVHEEEVKAVAESIAQGHEKRRELADGVESYNIAELVSDKRSDIDLMLSLLKQFSVQVVALALSQDLNSANGGITGDRSLLTFDQDRKQLVQEMISSGNLYAIRKEPRGWVLYLLFKQSKASDLSVNEKKIKSMIGESKMCNLEQMAFATCDGNNIII